MQTLFTVKADVVVTADGVHQSFQVPENAFDGTLHSTSNTDFWHAPV